MKRTESQNVEKWNDPETKPRHKTFPIILFNIFSTLNIRKIQLTSIYVLERLALFNSKII